MTISNDEIREFVSGYVECALWSSSDPDTEAPLDAEYDVLDFTSDACERAAYECAEFWQANEIDLTWYFQSIAVGDWTAESMAGHDFWLTRNGHGTGFWDREAGQAGENLADAARKYGEVNVFPETSGLEMQ